MNYLGQPQKFQFYSRRAFDRALSRLRTGATLEDATEEEFMEALTLTTKVCSNVGMIRNYAITYTGPQSFVQRGHASMMDFEPELLSKETVEPEAGAVEGCTDGKLEWIQCDDCDRWRRVDRRTYTMYHSNTWFRESSVRRRSQLLRDFPALPAQVHAWLLYSHRPGDAASADIERNADENKRDELYFVAEEVFRESVDPHGLLRTRFEVAWCELVLEISEIVKVDVPHDIFSTVEEAHAKDTRLFFSCSSLANCSCEDPDDWKEPFKHEHVLFDFHERERDFIAWRSPDGSPTFCGG